MVLPIIGLIFGALLILDGIFGWGLVRVVPGAPGSKNRTYVRISEAIVGVIFIVLAVIELSA
ncbi:MAG: hypothetical protein IPM60_03395 [Rhodospirillales bacterium]|nr:hypothetical protein [Rhodospirillales bacterium]